MAEDAVVLVDEVACGAQSQVVADLSELGGHVVGQSFPTDGEDLGRRGSTLVWRCEVSLLKVAMLAGVTSQSGRSPTPSSREMGSQVLSSRTWCSESQASLEPWWGEEMVVSELTCFYMPNEESASLASIPLRE